MLRAEGFFGLGFRNLHGLRPEAPLHSATLGLRCIASGWGGRGGTRLKLLNPIFENDLKLVPSIMRLGFRV